MWLGQQACVNRAKSRAGSGSGEISIAGEKAAVVLDSEKRRIPLILPGGYFWVPDTEREAMVLRDGDGLRYVMGLLGEEERMDPDIAPGEVALISEGGAVYLLKDSIQLVTENCSIVLKDGDVAISGKLLLNGIDVEAALKED